MSNRNTQHLQQEVELMTRFADAYRGTFQQIIDQMNSSPNSASDKHCIRLCVEAVNMMLTSQSNLARAIAEMTVKTDQRLAA